MSGGGIGLDHLADYEVLCAELGWHLQFLTHADRLGPVASRLSKLRVPFVIDHMGNFDAEAGTGSLDWQLVLKLIADGGWVKLSGAYRLSTAPGYADTVPFARSLIDVAPQRCLWGSDWPQVGFWGTMPNVGDLLDVLAESAPDPATREAILVANPARLYGFPGARRAGHDRRTATPDRRRIPAGQRVRDDRARATRVRCVIMRGGTSKGCTSTKATFPVVGLDRDALLLRLMGSPDMLQIDGLGGSRPITS